MIFADELLKMISNIDGVQDNWIYFYVFLHGSGSGHSGLAHTAHCMLT